MSLYVVSMEIDSAYGHFRWGFIRGITLGIRLGILLERHPLRPAKTRVRGPVGGSAGIPDSLGHKPVNTSGRAGGRLPAVSAPRLSPPPYCLLFGSITPFLISPRPFLFEFYARCRLLAFWSAPAACYALTCGNVVAFRSETRARAPGGDSGMAATASIEKSLENELPNLLHDARRRVIIELSPEEPKPHRIPRPARAMSKMGANYVLRRHRDE